MKNSDPTGWNPCSRKTKKNQRVVYDDMRERCPVAYSHDRGWSVFRHSDIMRILNDPETFSNEVSTHLSVPNGMDPPEHTKYRRIIEQYFEKERVRNFESACRKIASDLVEFTQNTDEAEFIDTFARSFAVRVQCAFMGWSSEMHRPLRNWTMRNIEAIRSRDRTTIKKVAGKFTGQIKRLLDKRCVSNINPGRDITTHLMHQTVNGCYLTDEQIISILRNWTMGEVGTITNAIGIMTHFIATHVEVQSKLRSGEIPMDDAIEEILRLHGPLVTNRRKTTCAVKIGERVINSGDQISINWVSANRDPRAFDAPEIFKPERDQNNNLLFGAGIHQCPAAPLARMELRVVLEELLDRTSDITISEDKSPVIAEYPASGYEQLYLRIK